MIRLAILILLIPSTCFAATGSSITQHGVTFTFDTTYTYGQYVNGDYWVLGPITINSITPTFNGYSNGMMVNPTVSGDDHGFQAGCYQDGFDANLNESLPYTSPESGTVSVVKVIGDVKHSGSFTSDPTEDDYDGEADGNDTRAVDTAGNWTDDEHNNMILVMTSGTAAGTTYTIDDTDDTGNYIQLNDDTAYTDGVRSGDSYDIVEDMPCITDAVVLTIVTATPAGNGAALFRPAYVGTTKTSYGTSDIQTQLLPTYAEKGTPITWSTIESNWEQLRLDHKNRGYNRSLRPSDYMGDGYQPDIGRDTIDDIVSLMTGAYTGDKPAALYAVLQAGIDKVQCYLDGQTWVDASGHQPAHLVHLAFTATLLDITAAKTSLEAATTFYAARNLGNLSVDGDYLFGQTYSTTEDAYWTYIESGSGSRSHQDPYDFIDGGKPYDGLSSYQNITSQHQKGEMLAVKLMPSLLNAWPDNDYTYAKSYAERFVSTGLWTSPDPCAPYDGTPGNRGTTYGPDGDDTPHDCILDEHVIDWVSATDWGCTEGEVCGRYADQHGEDSDAGQYRSDFIAAMWDYYYYTATHIESGAGSTTISAGGGSTTIGE